MKIKYTAPKGKRIKKGSTKIEGGRRLNNFSSITMMGDLWWDKVDKKWRNIDDIPATHSYSSNYYGIHSLKACISHIKRHPEIPRGTWVMLNSNFVGYDICIRV